MDNLTFPQIRSRMIKAIVFAILNVQVGLFADQIEKKSVDLVILDGTVVTMDASRTVILDGGVAIDQGILVAIGTKEEIANNFVGTQVINAKGKAVIPGLINGHTHLPMTLFRGIADDLDLQDWLFNHIFPAEQQNVDEHFVRAGTRLGLAELIRGGTTTFVDMYFMENAVAEETAKAGVRGIVAAGLIDFARPGTPNFEAALQQARHHIEKWKGHPLITPAIAPHSPYLVSQDHLQAITVVAKETGVPIIIHLSETEDEVAQIQKEKGMTPIEYLEAIGLFNQPVIAAHVVHATSEELSILKNHHVGIVHNIHSNLKLASGIAPIPEILRSGIAVGLGTDSAASNNDLSIWDEMDAAAKVHKVHSKDPKVVSAKEAFEMATIRGAAAIYMEDSIGSLEKGKKADIVLVNLDGIHQIPQYNIYSTLVYATHASDVSSVIINGTVVMYEGKLLTLDEEAIRRETEYISNIVKKNMKKE